MAKLIVNPTSSSRREVSLTRTLMSIGRDPSNDVVLPDAMVSRRHAIIEYRGSQYYLRDCNSSNGSLVNGDRVSERGLRDGDLVAIGTARLLFREQEDLAESGGKVLQHPSAPRLQCPACHADLRKGDLFCRQCGAALAPSAPPKAVCSSCGTVVTLPARFCNACGSPLPQEAAAEAPRPPRPGPPGPPPEPDPPPVPGDGPSPEPSPPPLPPIEARVVAGAAAPAPPSVSPDPPALVRPASPGSAPAAPAPGPASVRPFVNPSARPAAPRPAARIVPTDPIGTPAARPRRAEDARAARAADEVELGGFGPRLVAGLVDVALVGVAQALLVVPAVVYWRGRDPGADPAFAGVLLSVAALCLAGLLGVVYYVYYWGVKGATPGKKMLGLSVQDDEGGEPIGATRAAVRLLGYLVSAALFGTGFVMVAFGGRGLHDRIAGTRVVRPRRG